MGRDAFSCCVVSSVEYWFRCMDLDGDGIISMYEMEFFYEEQVEKMEMLGIETLPFQDCLCQVHTCLLMLPLLLLLVRFLSLSSCRTEYQLLLMKVS